MKKKKFLSAVLAASLLASTVPATAWASEPNTEPVATEQASARSGELEIEGGQEGVDYKVDGDVITILESTPLIFSSSYGEVLKTYCVYIPDDVSAYVELQSYVGMKIQNLGHGSELHLEASGPISSFCYIGQEVPTYTFAGELILEDNDKEGHLRIASTGDIHGDSGKIIVNDGSVDIDINDAVWLSDMEINNGDITFNQLESGYFDVNQFSIHGGNVRLSHDIDNCLFQMFCEQCTIDGGTISLTARTIINNDFYSNYSFWGIVGSDAELEDLTNYLHPFSARGYEVTSGEFYEANISENTVYGCPVAEGYAVAVGAIDENGRIKYKIVPENEITHLDITGEGFSKNNGVITLNDGANVSVSSKQQTYDQILVADRAKATLTLDGVNMYSGDAPISLGDGSELTLILADGSSNVLETVGELGNSAIETQGWTCLKIRGEGELKAIGSEGGAGIGTSEFDGEATEITIEDGVITAVGGNNAPGIGGSVDRIHISGGSVNAEGITGIGGGIHQEIFSIIIEDGTINAKGSSGAAIGAGPGGIIDTISILGGSTQAVSKDGAGIGSGQGLSINGQAYNSSVSAIYLDVGQITAKSEAAGIGGGNASKGAITSVGEILIQGSNVNANGRSFGIGAGRGGIGGSFHINMGIVIANSISDITDKENWRGLFYVDNINHGEGTLFNDYVTIFSDYEHERYLVIKDGQTLVVPEGVTLTNTGTIIVQPKGELRIKGSLEGNPVEYLEEEPGQDETAVTGVQLSKEKMTLKPEASKRLTATVLPENAANKNVTWSSSDENVAKVNKNGRVTAVAEGTAVITVTTEEGNFKASCKVTVKANAPEEIDVESVSLDKTTLTLKPGTSDTLTATVAPEDATDKSLRWTSSNTNVATVDATGKVTAVGNGTAVITVSTVDGGFTAQCTVTVSEDKPEIVAVENVTLDKTSASLEVGETEQLTATVKPADAANKSVRWKSNDENVVSVDANGKLTAISSGMATVTVTTEEGNFTALCKVTVTNPDDTTTDTETQPDGSTVTTVEDVNGSSSSTTVDANGVSTTTVALPETVIDQADRNDMAVTLPMVGVTAATDIDAAPSVTVDLPTSGATKVEIPVLDLTPGTVAVLVDENGNETIIPNSVLGNNGLIVTLADGDTVKILDNTQEYNDVAANHWAKGNIDYVTSRGLFVGVDDESFAPETSMTRAMIVSVLQRYAGDTTAAAPGSDWYEGARQWAMENGISDGTNMNGNVTREQLVTMLYRYIGSPQVVGSLNSYSDNANVSPYAEQAMVWAVRNGIIGGMTADTLAPQGMATRAQVAAILERFIAWEQA